MIAETLSSAPVRVIVNPVQKVKTAVQITTETIRAALVNADEAESEEDESEKFAQPAKHASRRSGAFFQNWAHQAARGQQHAKNRTRLESSVMFITSETQQLTTWWQTSIELDGLQKY